MVNDAERLLAQARRTGQELARMATAKPCTRCGRTLDDAGIYLLAVDGATGEVMHGFWCPDCLRAAGIAQ